MSDESQAQRGFDEADVASLSEKLADLDLSDGERAALAALMDDGVSGFAAGLDLTGGLGDILQAPKSLRDHGFRAGPGKGAAGVADDGEGSPGPVAPMTEQWDAMGRAALDLADAGCSTFDCG